MDTAMTFADEVKKELEELAKLNVPGAKNALKALERGDIVEIANVVDDPMSVREMADLIIDMYGWPNHKENQ
jgi:hypothetical protein